MPLAPPTPLSTASSLPRTPQPPRQRKTVAFSPLPPSSFNDPSPAAATPPEHGKEQQQRQKLGTATFHRFRRLEQLLEPSPAVEFSRRTRGEGGVETRALGVRTPVPAVRGTEGMGVSQQRRPGRVEARKDSPPPPPRPGREKKDGEAQTSPSLLRRSPPHGEERRDEHGPREDRAAQTSMSFVSSLRRERGPFSPPFSGTPPTRLSPPPPAATFTPRLTAPRPSLRPTPPPPAVSPSLPSASRPPLPAKPSPRAARMPAVSTVNLAPFRIPLTFSSRSRSSAGSKGKEKEGEAEGEVWVELLPFPAPSSSTSSSGGEGGDVLLDSRSKDGRVWLLSPSANSIALFHPPPSAGAPLVLLHPSQVFSHAKLFPASLPPVRAESEDAEAATLRKAAKRAWRAVEKVLVVVRSRTALAHVLLPHPAPSLSSTLSSRARCTIFSDLPSSAASYSLSATLPSGVHVGVYVSPLRDLFTLSLSPPSAPASTSSVPAAADTKRWSTRLSSLGSPPSFASAPDLEAFLLSALPPSSSGTAMKHLLTHALSPPFSALIARVREAHLAALAPPPLSLSPLRQTEQEQEREGAAEKRLISILCRALSLPRPVPPSPVAQRLPSSRRRQDGEGAGEEEEGDEEGQEEGGARRCLPGLGWIIRSPQTQTLEGGGGAAGKGGKEGRGWEYEVLFLDGEHLRLRLFCEPGFRSPPSDMEARKSFEGGRVEVEDRHGVTHVLPPPSPTEGPPPLLPKKLQRRMNLVVEMLALFLPSAPSSVDKEEGEGLM